MDPSNLNKIATLMAHNYHYIDPNIVRQITITIQEMYRVDRSAPEWQRNSYARLKGLFDQAEIDKKLPKCFHKHIIRYVHAGLKAAMHPGSVANPGGSAP